MGDYITLARDAHYKRSTVGFTLPPHSELTPSSCPPHPSFTAEVNRTSPQANAHTLSCLTQDLPTASALGWPLTGSDKAERSTTTSNHSASPRAIPSCRFLRIIQPLSDKPTLSLELVDFQGGNGAEGTSYLLSMLMDKIEEENSHLTSFNSTSLRDMLLSATRSF